MTKNAIRIIETIVKRENVSDIKKLQKQIKEETGIELREVSTKKRS